MNISCVGGCPIGWDCCCCAFVFLGVRLESKGSLIPFIVNHHNILFALLTFPKIPSLAFQSGFVTKHSNLKPW